MNINYIKNNFDKIKKYASVIEFRGEFEDSTIESVLKDNAEVLKQAKEHNVNIVFIDEDYNIEIEI